jgi:hypothetical protein
MDKELVGSYSLDLHFQKKKRKGKKKVYRARSQEKTMK